MQPTRIVAVLGVLLSCWAPAGLAAPRSLTLDQALAMAKQQHYDVLRAEEYRSRVEGRYVEERAAALPQLSLQAGGAVSQDESQEAFGEVPRQTLGFAEAGLTQPLFTWGKIGAAIRAAKLGLETADMELRIARQQVQRDVVAAFYDVLLAHELGRLASENLRQRERHRDEAERKFAAGVATDYDVLAAKVAVENARPETIRTANGVRAAQERLRFLLGAPEDVDAVGELSVVVSPAENYESAFAAALRQRPELAELRQRQKIQQELVAIAKADDKPRLDFKGSAGWRALDLVYDDGRSERGDGPAWEAGIYFSWPLFDGLRTRGRIAQTESELRGLVIDEAELREAIALEVRDSRNALDEAGEIVGALAGTVEQAKRLLEMAEKGYEFGVKTRIEVEDAQLNLLQAQSNLARAQRDYRVALARFVWAKGEE